MQFHLNGFEPGDPEVFDPSERYPASGAQGSIPEVVDVLIIGCGPAGLTLAAQLSAFPDIKTCIVEQKSGRMLLGQADGIACRTMEMFHAFGFSERVLAPLARELADHGRTPGGRRTCAYHRGCHSNQPERHHTSHKHHRPRRQLPGVRHP
jgi:2-polyprenyl-6-methoxyphenol hydroxylase-like FAD-dependent oxidoreductase